MKQNRKPNDPSNWLDQFKNILNKQVPGYEFYVTLLFDVKYINLIALALLFAEVPVSILMIRWAEYRDVDWHTYMQQTELMLNGTFNYANLHGLSGPCVYPAGFLYIFALLYHATGKDVRFSQYIFAGLYTLTLILVFRLYVRSKKVPPYVLIILCCTSYRIHATYMVHMFNDAVAMLLVYLSLNLFLDNHWNWGSAIYSIAASVKMNVLLFSPTLLLTYWTCLGFTGTLKQLIICAGIQLILGAPFLLTDPFPYIQNAFDFGRVFDYRWTVNWRFLPQYIFASKYFHITLLAVQLLLLAAFYSPWKKYLTSYARLKEMKDHIKLELGGCEKSVDINSASNALLDHNKPECERRKKSLDLSSASNAFLDCIKPEVTKRKKGLNMSSALNQFINCVKPEFKKRVKSLDRSSASNMYLDYIKPELKKHEKSLDMSSAEDPFPHQIEPDLEIRKESLDPSSTIDLFLLPMFTANFIGVACSRSLHMQFCVWYYHSLPYLLWSTKLPDKYRIMILIVIELCWDTCCSTVLSSSALYICHLAILYGLYQNRDTQLSSLTHKIKNPGCQSPRDPLLDDLILTIFFLFAFIFYYVVFFMYVLYFWDYLSWFIPQSLQTSYVCWDYLAELDELLIFIQNALRDGSTSMGYCKRS